MLNDDTIVATVMSNSGLFASLEEIGIKCEQTIVGDRFVYECMQKNDYCLGGEQSGHIILKKYATTGDGLLTAIMITEEICDSKLSLAKLAEPVMLYPQYIKNIRVKDKGAVLSDTAVLNEKKAVEELINCKGRALLRQSGTEPVIRIMIEAETEEKCTEYAERIADAVIKGGHSVG
jgi:phosphoglucosamine mutase